MRGRTRGVNNDRPAMRDELDVARLLQQIPSVSPDPAYRDQLEQVLRQQVQDQDRARRAHQRCRRQARILAAAVVCISVAWMLGPSGVLYPVWRQVVQFVSPRSSPVGGQNEVTGQNSTYTVHRSAVIPAYPAGRGSRPGHS